MLFHKHHPAVGSRPGTLAIPPGSPPPRIRLLRYSSDTVEERDGLAARGLAHELRPDAVCWFEVTGLGDEVELRQLGEEFGMHPLALEDAVNVPQRAKSELYEEHQLIIARYPLFADDRLVEMPQVCFFLGRGYLITVEERPHGFLEPVRERVRAGIGPIREAGADYLAYAALDALVDLYFPAAERLSARLDDLEDEVLRSPDPAALMEIHRIRRQVAVLRRVGWPQREAIGALLRERTPFMGDDVRLYLRDTADHVAQVVELLDSSREVATGLSEVYLSNVSQRTNEVMKVLTIMASIFIPLTFIAGIYGMNFEYMPELRLRDAYFGVLGAMLLLAAGMLLYFRHRGWIGGGRDRDEDRDSDRREGPRA